MKFDWIEPGVLAAGSIPVGINDLRSLHEQGIGAIVSLIEHPLTTQSGITPAVFDDLDMTYFHAPTPDGQPPDIATAQRVVDFIDQMASQGKATFIHCHGGIGRTGTMLHAYYLARGVSLDEAKKRVRSRRPACAFVILSETQRTFLSTFADTNRDNT